MHFVGLALLLFVGAEVVAALRADVIEVDPLEVEARVRQVERATGQALSGDERAALEQAYIDELILAREARELGLDDDTRVRAILSQKMLQLMSMDLTQPSDAELRAYFEENEDRYAIPPSVTVDQLLSPDEDTDPGQLVGSDSSERTVLRDVSLNELSIAFGAETAQRIFDAGEGEWVGPHLTAHGVLWFRTVERAGSRPAPEFEAIIGQVRFDWVSEYEELFLQERVSELRERYRIERLDGDGGVR